MAMLCDALTLGGLQYFIKFRYTRIIGAFIVVTVVIGVGRIATTSVSVSHFCFRHAISSRKRHGCGICVVM
jgi:hypothetical protein